MKLIEHDGKVLLRMAGMAVPHGRLLSPDDAWPGGKAMLKAQTLSGGRGKAGLVRHASGSDGADTLRALRGSMAEAPWVLAEELARIEAEYYLALTVDDVQQCPVLLLSARGGVEIEADPAAVHRLAVDPLVGLLPHHVPAFARAAGIPDWQVGAVSRFAAQLYRVFVAQDATLLEVNPLAATPDGLVALDVKCVLDDAAGFRHRDRAGLLSGRIQAAEMGLLERRAAAEGFTFVELDGAVALATGGAGLGMAVLDMMTDAGLTVANFIDAPGGGTAELARRKMDLVFDWAERPEVRAIAFYTVLAASSLKNAVEGLLDTLDRRPPPKPLVAGFVATGAAEAGMTMAEAAALMAERGIVAVTELSELADALVRVGAGAVP